MLIGPQNCTSICFPSPRQHQLIRQTHREILLILAARQRIERLLTSTILAPVRHHRCPLPPLLTYPDDVPCYVLTSPSTHRAPELYLLLTTRWYRSTRQTYREFLLVPSWVGGSGRGWGCGRGRGGCHACEGAMGPVLCTRAYQGTDTMRRSSRRCAHRCNARSEYMAHGLGGQKRDLGH